MHDPTNHRCPVTGAAAALETEHWQQRFDHADPAYNANAPAIWDALRNSGCPVAHTAAYGGTWLPVTHELVQAIAYDTERYSSVGVVVANHAPDWSQQPLGGAAPITSDPPAHAGARRLLLPAFSPKAIEPLEPEVRALCERLLDDIETTVDECGVIDAAAQYAAHIPVQVIATMLGVPVEDAPLFREFVHVILEAVDIAEEERADAIDRVVSYIRGHVETRRSAGADGSDLISYLCTVRDASGAVLSVEHIVGTVILLLVAGIDTTWSAIGSALHHFAEHPADRAAIADDPALLPAAVEELLRAYAPVTMARVVAEDHELGGAQLRRGDWVLLPFPAANRDPAVFADADTVILDRAANRHSAFGLGIHRCLGSNLARLEMRVAIECFLNRFEVFEPAGDVQWSVGQVRGPRRLPLRVGR